MAIARRKRQDSACIRLKPDTKGRLTFYKTALKASSHDEAIMLLMDIAQARINDISHKY
jgi:hypothetical protein